MNRFQTAILLVALVATSFVAHATHPIVGWVLDGDTAALRDAAQRQPGTSQGLLASALVNDDAATATPIFRQLVEDASLPDELKAVAWQRLHGYAVIVNNVQLASDAAAWLNDHTDVTTLLFHGDLPAAPNTHFWTVQIGAFSSRTNADRLAADQRSQGYTAQVDPLMVNGQTLYAVRVGKFDDRSEADSFAQRAFGSGGYRVVEKQ